MGQGGDVESWIGKRDMSGKTSVVLMKSVVVDSSPPPFFLFGFLCEKKAE